MCPERKYTTCHAAPPNWLWTLSAGGYMHLGTEISLSNAFMHDQKIVKADGEDLRLVFLYLYGSMILWFVERSAVQVSMYGCLLHSWKDAVQEFGNST